MLTGRSEPRRPYILGPLVGGPLAELLLQLHDQSLPVAHGLGWSRSAILGQLGTALSSAQVGELGVVADGHDEGLSEAWKVW